MTVEDVIGLVAGAMVVLTFSTSQPVRLRLAGIVSNALFIAYALSAGLLPILVLHALLMPINLLHLARATGIRLLDEPEACHCLARDFASALPLLAWRPPGRDDFGFGYRA